MKTALLIDGGYLRAEVQTVGKRYDANFVRSFSQLCVDSEEYLFRIFYYDARPYDGRVQLPVSGEWKQFTPSNFMMDDLRSLRGLPFAMEHWDSEAGNLEISQ
jgi:hypothetical protein